MAESTPVRFEYILKFEFLSTKMSVIKNHLELSYGMEIILVLYSGLLYLHFIFVYVYVRSLSGECVSEC